MKLRQRAGITSGKDVNSEASAREEAGADKTASAVWPQPPDLNSEPQSLERRRQRQGERTGYTSGRQGKKGMQGKETVGVVPLPYGDRPTNYRCQAQLPRYTLSV
jgi:hypothetical protein